MVHHGICQMTMKCMLLARTRFLERFFREVFSIPVNRSFRTRARRGCSARFLVPIPKINGRVDTVTRPFLIIEGCGVIVRRTMTPAQRAMMSGLAQVIQRISSSASTSLSYR